MSQLFNHPLSLSRFPFQSYHVFLSHIHTRIQSLKHFPHLLFSLSPGLPGGPLSAPGLGGREAEPRRPHRTAGPQRPQPGKGYMETRGVLPQRQARRVPVRHGAQRVSEDQPAGADTLYAEVR